MAEKCMCESCKISRGEGDEQIAARRRRLEQVIMRLLYMILGFGFGFAVAELLKGL